MQIKHHLAPARALVCALLASASAFAQAGSSFPVTGSVTMNGNASAIPAGATFGPSSYDPETGELAPSTFVFPPSSTTITVPGFGTVTVNFQITQTNTSSALVEGDGVAAMSPVQLRIALVSTSLPLPVTPCRFEPINLDLAGTGSGTDLELSDEQFTIPPTTDSCGGFASQINAQIPGANNSASLTLVGDFTPPTEQPVDPEIFEDGFEEG